MKRKIAMAVLIAAATVGSSMTIRSVTADAATDELSARKHHYNTDASGNKVCANGTVARQTAYGISICVDPKYADKFVAFTQELHDAGCKIKEIVCQAYDHTPGSNHIGGGACDYDQSGKNKTSSCLYHAGSMIRSAGLYDGCSFRDCGHVEAMRGLGNYGSRHYASRRSTRTYAARSHRYQQVAYAPAMPMRDMAKNGW